MNPINQNNQHIINTLLLNSSFIDNLGLMHGKMGISIFFFLLARKTNIKIYEDYAGELIDEIYDEITADTPVDFENGLAGIGWGIEYLVQNGFIEADTDEVLEEFDNLIFNELVSSNIQNTDSIDKLIGLGLYFIKRIQNASTQPYNTCNVVNRQTLVHLIDILDESYQHSSLILAEPKSVETEGTVPIPIFDISWSYATLLYLLSGVYMQKINLNKTEKLITGLIEPLLNNNNSPELHSNRLLLAFMLAKLQYRLKPLSKTLDIGTLNNEVLDSINHETIESEICNQNLSLKSGSPGIAYIYNQLFALHNCSLFKNRMDFWSKQSNAVKYNMGKNFEKGKEQNWGGIRRDCRNVVFGFDL